MKRIALCLMLFWLSPAFAGEDQEIEFLLTAVEQSNCTFIRNDKPHPADEAADHLRMKYGRARWAVDNAEEFIDRIASKSTLSGDPYRVQCDGAEPELTRTWLTARLAEYRVASAEQHRSASNLN